MIIIINRINIIIKGILPRLLWHFSSSLESSKKGIKTSSSSSSPKCSSSSLASTSTPSSRRSYLDCSGTLHHIQRICGRVLRHNNHHHQYDSYHHQHHHYHQGDLTQIALALFIISTVLVEGDLQVLAGLVFVQDRELHIKFCYSIVDMHFLVSLSKNFALHLFDLRCCLHK